MKILVSIFILVISLFQNKTFGQDTLHWKPGYQLKWSDFQGKPDSKSVYKAISTAAISYSLSTNETLFSFKVSCFFYKNESWTTSNSIDLLTHEQGHFNIAELFTRKLRQEFSNCQSNSATTPGDFRKIFDEIIKAKDEMDSRYDEETDLSRNKSKQLYWNKKIDEELKKLDVYAL
jgi:hypothetical protein